MQLSWLIKNNSKKLIIFFNGWSLDENIVNHLTSLEYDVVMFYDYSNLDVDKKFLKELNNYAEINVIAWSFGVWACSIVINMFSGSKNVIAINGTLIPIDNIFGIPERMFNLTLSNFSEKTYPKFFQNMFAEEVDLNKLPQRSIESQRQELIQIQKLSYEKIFTQNIGSFTKIFIGTNDKIISAKNQLNFWGLNEGVNEGLEIIKKESEHYIFNLFKTWDEILNYA